MVQTVVGRLYSKDGGRAEDVDVAVDQSTGRAWVAPHLARNARRSTIYFNTDRGRRRMVVFCAQYGEDDPNAAVYRATGLAFRGEFLVLSAVANVPGTKFSQMRTAWHAHQAVQLLINAINNHGTFPRVVIEELE